MDEQRKRQPTQNPVLTGPIDINSALSEVLRIYGNGFSIGHSFLEATILVQNGKTPIAAIQVTFPALKSLHLAIGDVLTNLENGFGEKVPTIEEAAAKWKPSSR